MTDVIVTQDEFSCRACVIDDPTEYLDEIHTTKDVDMLRLPLIDMGYTRVEGGALSRDRKDEWIAYLDATVGDYILQENGWYEVPSAWTKIIDPVDWLERTCDRVNECGRGNNPETDDAVDLLQATLDMFRLTDDARAIAIMTRAIYHLTWDIAYPTRADLQIAFHLPRGTADYLQATVVDAIVLLQRQIERIEHGE